MSCYGDPVRTDVDRLLDAPPVVVAVPFCACGHQHGEHRIDLKKQACDRGGCPCTTYAEDRWLYRVSRWADALPTL